MRRLRCGCRGNCRCGKEIVYPTREEVKNTYSEETVKHIHPSHTTVINHHTIRNEHFYPHSTSFEERVREVDVRGVRDGSSGPRGDVRGVRDDRYDDVRGAYDDCYKRKCYPQSYCRPRRSWW